ncbi:FAR-17a/AIG1-like protein [Roridomyces roridus]|uniref:FAR-17a/AIG1-like protein n=1 Tax=Roridomyces roridus TaxID=1738132 RepID=A0AAD7BWB9_9AGAR|nr:FAR-17a/AIG1-like protein [Roridomyces roridus]
MALQFLLHAGAISTMTYGYNALHHLTIDSFIASQYGGHLQFLTIQGLAVSWLTMVAALLANLFPSIKAFRSVKRSLFIVAMPVEVMVSSIYWPLLLFWPHLILQAMPGESAMFRIPLRIDFCLHAMPAISLLADFMLFEKKYRRSGLALAPVMALVATVGYSTWAEHCATKNGTFPYPFLTVNPFEIRLRIYTAVGVCACISFYALNALHR